MSEYVEKSRVLLKDKGPGELAKALEDWEDWRAGEADITT